MTGYEHAAGWRAGHCPELCRWLDLWWQATAQHMRKRAYLSSGRAALPATTTKGIEMRVMRDVLRAGPARIDVYGSGLPRLTPGGICEDGYLTVWVDVTAPGASEALAGVQVGGRLPGWLARRLGNRVF